MNGTNETRQAAIPGGQMGAPGGGATGDGYSPIIGDTGANCQAAEALLAALGMERGGWLQVKCFNRAGQVRLFWHKTPASLLRSWPQLEEVNRRGYGVYFGPATYHEKRGVKANAAWLYTVHADLDGKDFVDDPADWRRGVQLALAMLENLPQDLAPGIVIDTGHGAHCYWPLGEPLPATPENIEGVEAVNAALAVFLGSDPAVKDVSRVLRLPGLLNNNCTWLEDPEPLPVAVIEGPSGRRWSLADFVPIMPQPKAVPATNNGGELRPGEDFNTRGNWAQLLTAHGWKEVGKRGDSSYWQRPGKDQGVSARLNHSGDGLLRVYSSSAAPLQANTSYSLFGAYAALKHGGDFNATTKALAGLGYGTPPTIHANEHNTPAAAHVNGNGNGQAAPVNWQPASRKTIWTTPELLSTEFPEPRWAVPGLVPVGLSFLAGRPKIGKSWLALQFAIAIGSGGKVFGEDVERRKVLYLALEDSERRIKDRAQKQGIPGNAAVTWATEWATIDAGGGDAVMNAVQAGGFGLVIIDTLGRFVGNSDQQNLAAMTVLMGGLQRLALVADVAVLFVDHHRKPSAMAANVIDDIMGSTGKAAAADAVLGLYKVQGRKGAQLAVVGRDMDEKTLALEFDALTGCWQSLGDAGDVQKNTVSADIVSAIAELVQLGQVPTTVNIAEHTAQRKQNVNRALLALVTAGHVIRGPKQGREQPYFLPGQIVNLND